MAYLPNHVFISCTHFDGNDTEAICQMQMLVEFVTH